MKPTRHIVKPNKGYWTPKHSVWFQKNDDDDIGKNNWDEEELKSARKLGYPATELESWELNKQILLERRKK